LNLLPRRFKTCLFPNEKGPHKDLYPVDSTISGLAGTLTEEQLLDKLAKTKETKMQPMAKMPSHDEFLEMFGEVS